ncbi:IS200/IS605 family transposase [Calidithermus timidus]|jgi:putative transposase|uniref:IS200/IS605 family transposase n=1 Tax=Calidithermus timidus TaxID=307124 RepID=UPI00037602F0|nr:IS200/IS605 family transposase [Calidithermus timidus]
MVKLKTANNAVFRLSYHLVLVTKYRRKCLTGLMLEELREKVAQVCEQWGCEMVEFSGEADHVHLLFEATPTVEPAKFVNSLKTVTSRALRKRHAEHLSKFYWKPVLWSGSYALMTADGAPLEVLKQYIQGQRKPPK